MLSVSPPSAGHRHTDSSKFLRGETRQECADQEICRRFAGTASRLVA